MTKPGEQKRKRAVKVAAVFTVAGVLLLVLAYNVVVTKRAQEVAIREAGEQAATQADHNYAQYLANFSSGCSALGVVFAVCEPLTREEWAREWRVLLEGQERARRAVQHSAERMAAERARRKRLEEPSPLGDYPGSPGSPEPARSAPSVRKKQTDTDDPLAGIDVD